MSYLLFYGHHKKKKLGEECLSQWYEQSFFFEGITFLTAEHWMMYNKAMLFGAHEVALKILDSKHPSEAKKLGKDRSIQFDQEIWDHSKMQIVIEGNYLKFSQNEDLKQYLLSTKPDELVEASQHDCIWGIGLSKTDPRALDKSKWKGENLLGQALMSVRDELLR